MMNELNANNRSEIAVAVAALEQLLVQGSRHRVVPADALGDHDGLTLTVGALVMSAPNTRIAGAAARTKKLRHVDAVGLGADVLVCVPGLMVVLDGEYARCEPIGWCTASDVIWCNGEATWI